MGIDIFVKSVLSQKFVILFVGDEIVVNAVNFAFAGLAGGYRNRELDVGVAAQNFFDNSAFSGAGRGLDDKHGAAADFFQTVDDFFHNVLHLADDFYF